MNRFETALRRERVARMRAVAALARLASVALDQARATVFERATLCSSPDGETVKRLDPHVDGLMSEWAASADAAHIELCRMTRQDRPIRRQSAFHGRGERAAFHAPGPYLSLNKNTLRPCSNCGGRGRPAVEVTPEHEMLRACCAPPARD